MTLNVHVTLIHDSWLVCSSRPSGYLRCDVHLALQLNRIHDSTDSTCQKDVKPAPPIAFLVSIIDWPRLLVAQGKHLRVILNTFLFHSASGTSTRCVDPSHRPLPWGSWLLCPTVSLCSLPSLLAGFLLYSCRTNYYPGTSWKQYQFIIYDICLLLIMKTTNYFLLVCGSGVQAQGLLLRVLSGWNQGANSPSGSQLIGRISFHVAASLRPLLPVHCWPRITCSSWVLLSLLTMEPF